MTEQKEHGQQLSMQGKATPEADWLAKAKAGEAGLLAYYIASEIEARGGERSAFETEVLTAQMRLYAAKDPRAEFALWLKDRMDLNQSIGGEDMSFLTFLIIQVMQFRLPVGCGDGK